MLFVRYLLSQNPLIFLPFPQQVQAGLSALEDALETGYEDFKVIEQIITKLLWFSYAVMLVKLSEMLLPLQTIRTDPDLDNIRKSEEFEALLKNYDESFINENAINAIKSLFGLLKKE